MRAARDSLSLSAVFHVKPLQSNWLSKRCTLQLRTLCYELERVESGASPWTEEEVGQFSYLREFARIYPRTFHSVAFTEPRYYVRSSDLSVVHVKWCPG